MKRCIVTCVAMVVLVMSSVIVQSYAAEAARDKNTWGQQRSIPSSAQGFKRLDWSGLAQKSNSTHSVKQSTTGPVVSNESGTFNGKNYAKSETTTKTFTLGSGRELSSTSVVYFNEQGQKVGSQSTFGGHTRKTTYEFDSAGNLVSQVSETTVKGRTDKTHGKEFTRVITRSTTYAYEDVKNTAGAVVGKQTTATSTFNITVDGVARIGVHPRTMVSVTVTGLDGKVESKSITTTRADGSKRVYEDGKLVEPEQKKLSTRFQKILSR